MTTDNPFMSPFSQAYQGVSAPTTDPFQQFLMSYMQQSMQPKAPMQPQGGGIGEQLHQALAPYPTHSAAGNIDGGGSLFDNRNFYNTDGSRVQHNATTMSAMPGYYGASKVLSPQAPPSTAMMNTPGFHLPGMSVLSPGGPSGVYMNGQQQIPSGGPLPTANPGVHPFLQGLMNYPGAQMA